MYILFIQPEQIIFDTVIAESFWMAYDRLFGAVLKRAASQSD